MSCRVDFHVEPQFASAVDLDALNELAQRVLHGEGVPQPAEAGVVIVDDSIIRDLNRRFRDEDRPTDVLSFGTRESTEEPFVTPPDGIVRLGEVIVSLETAVRQASDAGHSLLDEVSHLLVHGLLHLLGYDHEREEDERAMLAREDAYLAGFRHQGS